MREGDRPTSPRLERDLRGLLQQGRRERGRRRSRRVGEDWTEKINTDVSDVFTSTPEDRPLSIRQRQAQNPRFFRQKMDRCPWSTCDSYFILVLSSPFPTRLDDLRVSSILSPTVP